MPTVLLARHGRTTANASGILAGRSAGVHVDEHGRDQARAAATRLEGLPLAAVVSSPMLRCKETAKLLVPGTTPHLDRGLTECDYGDWTGRPLKELAREKLWKTVQSRPSAATFPGGESMSSMSARGADAVRRWDERIRREHGADAIWLAVSHGDVIKAILADALGMHLDSFQRLDVSPASISVIDLGADRPTVTMINSTAGSLAGLASRGRKPRSRGAVVGGSAD